MLVRRSFLLKADEYGRIGASPGHRPTTEDLVELALLNYREAYICTVRAYRICMFNR